MVRVTDVLARIPVIKFRKGGLDMIPRSSGAGSASGTQAAAPSAGSSQRQPSASMSTSSIPDLDLPLRYRRIPLTEDEIEYINGGGIV